MSVNICRVPVRNPEQATAVTSELWTKDIDLYILMLTTD
jgi:hypothetical protein